MITASKYHDFSAGHRVFGHESKCAHLHGHNYRIHFTVGADIQSKLDAADDPEGICLSKQELELDKVGRVLDFSVIGSILCQWLEDNWDHKFLVFCDDPWAANLVAIDPDGAVVTDFNPTAENMALHLMYEIAPNILPEHIKLVECVIEETRKCSVKLTEG